MKKRKKGSKKPNTAKDRSRMLNGLVIRFCDTDPLGDKTEETVQGLPYSHRNPAYLPIAKHIFKDHSNYIFANDFNWQIDVTPISESDKPMKDTVIYSAFCRVNELTDAVEDYIESVLLSMNDLELEFLKTWKFECRIKL